MRKEFTVNIDDQDIKLFVRQPNALDVEAAERQYAEAVADVVRDTRHKLMLRSQLDKFLVDSNIWTAEDAEKADTLRNKISQLLNRLRAGGCKLSEGRKIALEVTDTRMLLVGHLQKRQIFDDSTIEAIADQAKFDHLVFSCTVKESGDQFWESYEDLKKDKLQDSYKLAAAKMNEFIYGITDNFEKELPENKWLKKYGFVDDELRLVDKNTKGFVNRDGVPIEQVRQQIVDDLRDVAGEIVEATPFVDDISVVQVENPVDQVNVEAISTENTKL